MSDAVGARVAYTPAGTLGASLLARDRLLPVTELISGSLPLGGLQRGTTTIVAPGRKGVGGTTSLALELVAGASMNGHWCAAVGLANLGLKAASERGIALERFIVVPRAGTAKAWQQVLAALFDGVAAVLFSPEGPVRPAEARKVSARAKDRGSTLVVLDRRGWWPEPGDLSCRVVSSKWSGLAEGHGLLSERSLDIEVSGRGAAARPLRSCVSLSQLGRST